MPSVNLNNADTSVLPACANPRHGRSGLLATTALALAVTFLGMEGAMAQEVWDGSTDTDWYTGANWSGGSVPTVPQDVEISDGSLPNQPVLAAGDTDRVASIAVSGGSLQVDGTLRADNGTTITGSGAVTVGGTGELNGGVTNSGGTLDIDAGGRAAAVTHDGGTTTNDGTITTTLTVSAGGMDNNGTVNDAVTITAGQVDNNGTFGNGVNDTVSVGGGTSRLDNNTGATVTGTLTNGGVVINNGTIGEAVHNGTNFSNFGTISRDLTVNANGFTNQTTGVVAGDVDITAGSVTNRNDFGDSTTDTVTVAAGATLTSIASGSIAGTLINAGTTTTTGTANAVVHNGGTLTNNGQIATTLTVNANGATNNGGVDGNTSVTAGTLVNTGDLGDDAGDTTTIAAGAGLTNQSAGVVQGTLTNAGTVVNDGAATNVVHNGGTFTNNGDITGDLTVNANGFTNAATGGIEGNTAVVSGTLNNDGALGNDGGDLTAVSAGARLNNNATGSVAGTLQNSGTVVNDGTAFMVQHDAGSLTNNGDITGSLVVNANGATNAATGVVEGVTLVNAGTLNNDGALGDGAGDSTTVAAGARLNNNATGTVAGTLDNSGTVINDGTVNAAVHNGGTFSNRGEITDTLSVTANGFTNQVAGTVNGDVSVTGGTLINRGTLGDDPGDGVTIGAAGGLNNVSGATVESTLFNSGTTTNSGSIHAVVHDGGTFSNSGTIETYLSVWANGFTNNLTGNVNGDFEVVAGTMVNSGDLGDDAGDSAFVDAGATLTNNSTGNVAGTLTNRGNVTNAGDMNVVVHEGGTFSNTGDIDGTLTVQADGFTNQTTGDVNGNVSISAGKLVNLGDLGDAAADSVTLTGGELENGATGDVNGTVVNNGGTVTNLLGGDIAALENNSGTTNNSGDITGATTVTGGVVNNLATGTMNTVESFGDFNNSGTVTGASTVTGGTYDNTGTVAAVTNDGGTVTNTGAGVMASLTNLLGGTTNSATITGAATVSGGTLDNSGSMGSLSQTGGTVTHSGTINTTAMVTGGTLNVNGGTVTGLTTNNGGTLNINAGTFTGGLTNTAGTVQAQGAVTGNITNAATFSTSGAMTGNGANVFANSGTVNVIAGNMTALGSFTNTGTTNITGRTLGATTVGNSSQMFITNGTVAGAFTNTGTVTVSGASTVSGAFTNNGTADLADGVFGDSLTISGLTSGNGIYQLDLNLSTGATDLITASGGTAGNVTLQFATTGGGVILAPTTVMTGLSGGTGLSFTGLPIGGAILYSVDQTAGNVTVSGGVNPAVAGVAASAALTQSLIGTVVNRPTSPFVSGLAAEESCSHGGYLRATGGIATVEGETSSLAGTRGTSIDSRFYGAQAGYDFGCFDGRFFNGWDGAAGIMLGYNVGSTEQGIFSDPLNPTVMTGVSGADFQQSYIGAYVAGSKDRLSGDLQLRYDSTSFDLSETTLIGAPIGLDGLSYSTDTATVGARINYRLDVNEERGINFIPTFGFNYSSTSGATVTLNDQGTPLDPTDDTALQIDGFNTVVGFVGGTLARTKISEAGDSAVTTFLSGNYYQDFGGDRTASFDVDGLGGNPADPIAIRSIGGFGEASVGLNYVKILDRGPGGAKQLNANIRADARFGDNVTDSFSLTAQIRLSF